MELIAYFIWAPYYDSYHMGHLVCAHSVSKAVQNTHKMADGWLQFETEPSVLYTIVFSRSCQNLEWENYTTQNVRFRI